MSTTIYPQDGVDKCPCGCKYWDGVKCFDCGVAFQPIVCEQCHDRVADCYAGGAGAGDWAGNYCYPCQEALGFTVWDRHR